MNITNALAALSGLLKAFDVIAAWLKTKRENAEMTPEQEAEFDAYTAERMKMPHWKPSDE